MSDENKVSDECKGFKCFNAKFACNPAGVPVQYAVGKTYISDAIAMCRLGFHFCVNPLDTLNYYHGCTARFGEVTARDQVKHGTDKSVTSNITVDAELTLDQFIEACWAARDESKCVTDDYHLASPMSHVSFLVGKSQQQAAVSGNYNTVFGTRTATQIAIGGDANAVVNTGDRVCIAASGFYTKVLDRGHNTAIADSGWAATLLSSGAQAIVVSSGRKASIRVEGPNSVAAALGEASSIRASLGTWITLAEYDARGNVIKVRSAKVDGKRIKADIVYRLKNGRFVQAK